MIQSVVKALDLLTLLSESPPDGMSLVELSELAGLKVPTTFNMLGTLENEGFALRNPHTRKYTLGARAMMLGQSNAVISRLTRLTQPYVSELAEDLAETVILSVYHRHLRCTIAAQESSQLLRVSAQITEDTHFYLTATGRTLLSLLPASALEALWERNGAPGDQWPEVTDFQNLQASLEQIRSRGHVDFCPRSAQLRALAVPISLQGAPPAALGVFYPLSRDESKNTAAHYIELMKNTACRIQEEWNGGKTINQTTSQNRGKVTWTRSN